MSAFVDKVMLDLSDPAKLSELVSPAADTTHARVRQLFAIIYAMPFATLHDVLTVDVLETDFQRPLFPPGRLAGTWTQTAPSYTRSDVLDEGLDGLVPEWVDVSPRLAPTVALEVEAGEVESIQLNDAHTDPARDLHRHDRFDRGRPGGVFRRTASPRRVRTT
jgi:hypothetical protein